MTSLEQTLTKLAHFLEKNKIPYMVIGGVANLFWGLPRTTLDVDVTVRIQEKELDSLIKKISRRFRHRTSNPKEFILQTQVLPLEDTNGVRADLVMAVLPYEEKAIERARTQKIGRQKVRIISPEDLIIYKIISDRPKDQEDVRGIIQKVGSSLDRKYLDPAVKQLANALSKADIWSFYLACFKKK